jgi:hypothetical protein
MYTWRVHDMPPNTITPASIAALERRKKALEFRAMGLTYKEVFQAMLMHFGAEALPGSYDNRYAYRDCKEEMDRLRADTMESAAQMRWIEQERLDMLQSRLMPLIMSGKTPELKAVDRVLRIMDHRAKLFGLYAPATVKVTDWRTEIIELYKSGKITKDMVIDEYGEEFARELLEPGRPDAIEGRIVEEESPTSTPERIGGQVAPETSS